MKPCHYCHAPGLTRDHIVPRAWGGLDRAWNVVPACRACNGHKAASWPTCQCPACAHAVSRWGAGERVAMSRAVRAIVRRRKGVWRVTLRGGGSTLVTFRTLARAHDYATGLRSPL